MNHLKESMNKVRIMVIGDAILDVYKYGGCDRTSTEAPVSIFLQGKEEYKLGGAANVVLNISDVIGSRTSFVSKVGFDKEGEIIKGLCADQNIRATILWGTTPTTTKTRYFSKNKQVFRADREIISAPIEIGQILTSLETFANNTDPKAVIISDYNKGLLDENTIQDLLHWCSAAGIPTVVEAKKPNPLIYTAATIVKLDDHYNENSAMVNCENFNKAGCKNVITVMLYKGVVFNGKKFTFAETLIDPTGARDTMTAMLGLGLALKLDMLKVMKLASIGYRNTAKKIGIIPIELVEFKEMLSELETET